MSSFGKTSLNQIAKDSQGSYENFGTLRTSQRLLSVNIP
jgi:hypothetical protein